MKSSTVKMHKYDLYRANANFIRHQNGVYYIGIKLFNNFLSTIKVYINHDIKVYNLLGCNAVQFRARRFRGTYCLCLQRWRVGQSRNAASSLAYSLTLKTEAICSSEMSSSVWPARHYNPKDNTLHSHCHENLKSNMIYKHSSHIKRLSLI
jgi:hypothetical protein